MQRRFIRFALFALLIALACSDKPSGSFNARLNVYVQDGMADYDSIYIVVDTGYVYTELDSTARTVILARKDTIQITEFRNGRRYLLTGIDIPPMEIEGIDLVFSDGRVFIDGESHLLETIQQNAPVHGFAEGAFSIFRGRQNNALIDILLFESIIYDGSGSHAFNPTLRLIDIDSSGSISGRTIPQANIYLFEHDSPDTLTFTISEGAEFDFIFYGLKPGFYDVLCVPIGADTLTYGNLLNYNVPAVIGDDYYMGILDLPEL